MEADGAALAARATGLLFFIFSSPCSRFACVLFAVVDSSVAWPGRRSLRVVDVVRFECVVLAVLIVGLCAACSPRTRAY